MNLRGVVPVMLTPFTNEEDIDTTSLRKELDFAIEAGASAVCAPAFASEYYKLSDSERYEVAKIVVEQTTARVPVFVSTGSGSVRSTVEFCRYAESIGAQGLMVAVPADVPLGWQEVTRFYEKVCTSVRVPVIIQDADFSGSGLPATLFVNLAERCPNLRFAKLENVLAGEKCAEITRRSRGRVQVLFGMGGIGLLDGLAHGASAIMPGAALVDLHVKIFRLYDSGQMEEAKSIFYRMQPYLTFGLQHLELHLAMEKQVLMRRGIIASDRLREPTLHLDDVYRKQSSALVEMVIRLTEEVRSPGLSNRRH